MEYSGFCVKSSAVRGRVSGGDLYFVFSERNPDKFLPRKHCKAPVEVAFHVPLGCSAGAMF